MAYLLDTHTFLWFTSGNDQMPLPIRQLIANSENEILISIASLWEMAIKVRIGKLILGRAFEDLIPEQLLQNDIQVLSISLDSLSLLTKLPLHHRDPFDRLIIAQAITNNIPIIGADRLFANYPVEMIW